MAKVYYSTIFEHSVDKVWSKISNFNDDRWSGDVTESSSENGKSGSTVGTIRVHTFGGQTARSDLRAYSAVDHFLRTVLSARRHCLLPTINPRCVLRP